MHSGQLAGTGKAWPLGTKMQQRLPAVDATMQSFNPHTSPHLDEVLEGLEPRLCRDDALEAVQRVDEAGEVRPEGELVHLMAHVEHLRHVMVAQELYRGEGEEDGEIDTTMWDSTCTTMLHQCAQPCHGLNPAAPLFLPPPYSPPPSPPP